jgi:two-component system response regulator NreC
MPGDAETRGGSYGGESSWHLSGAIARLPSFGLTLDVSILSLNFKVRRVDFLQADWRGVRDGDAKKIKVIVAEEPTITRDGLISLLRGVENIEVLEETRDSAEIAELAEHLRPDVVLIDPSIRGKSGLSVAKEIKKRFPETKVLVLTSYDSEDYIRAAFKAGADGYCLTGSGLQELVLAIESVLAGKVYFTPAISNKILDGYLRAHKPTRVDLLTHREKEILKLLGEGLKNGEIAQLLSISDKTVAKHKSNIMRKLDCHTTSDLTVFAIQLVF